MITTIKPGIIMHQYFHYLQAETDFYTTAAICITLPLLTLIIAIVLCFLYVKAKKKTASFKPDVKELKESFKRLETIHEEHQEVFKKTVEVNNFLLNDYYPINETSLRARDTVIGKNYRVNIIDTNLPPGDVGILSIGFIEENRYALIHFKADSHYHAKLLILRLISLKQRARLEVIQVSGAVSDLTLKRFLKAGGEAFLTGTMCTLDAKLLEALNSPGNNIEKFLNTYEIIETA